MQNHWLGKKFMPHEKINCFVDSNIWLYGFLKTQDIDKSNRANKLINDSNLNITVSTQVINEVCINLRKKTKISESGLETVIKNFYHRYSVLTIEEHTLLKASELRQHYNLSFWDSLMVSSALQANVEVFYSEDMQHNLIIHKTLKIVNPFL